MPRKDRDERLAYLKDWQSRNGEYIADWEAANRERRLAQKRQWRAEHVEHVKEYNAEYRRTHPKTRRRLSVRYYHDLTLEELDALYVEQRGRCAICDRAAPKRGRGCLHIDHDHATGERRGLLCKPCNTALHMVDQLGATWVLRSLAYLGDPPLPRLRRNARDGTA